MADTNPDPPADSGSADPQPDTATGEGQSTSEQSATDEPDKDWRKLYEQAVQQSRKWESRAKSNADKAKQWDQAEEAQRSEAEKHQARAEEAEGRAHAAVNSAIRAEIRAAAHGWASPQDAPRYVDDWSKYVGEDGEIDTDAIAADVAAVLTERPYLAAETEPTRRGPSPDPSQGARGGVSIADQIRHAESTGDTREALRLKTEQLLGRSRQG